MPRPEEVHIQRHVTYDELIKMIKSEDNSKVIIRLFFVKYRYEGKSVIEASKLVGISRRVAYIWQSRWNEGGRDALIPRWGGGCPSRLSDQDKEKLKQVLHQKDGWTVDEVHDLIARDFGIDYSLKQIRVILKQLGMNYAEPYPNEHRHPDDSEENLKKNPRCWTGTLSMAV